MPLSSLLSTPCPRNPRSPSGNDPGDDGNEDPFNDDNNNDNDDDNNNKDNDDYEDADNGTQEDWAVQVFESLTHTIDSLAHASQKYGSFTDPKKLCTFLVQCKLNFQDQPSTFKKDHAKVVFMQFYLKGMALEWFEPDLLSSINLQPPQPSHQCINKYMVKFNWLTSQVRGYGNGALHHQFYSGLPDCIKDEICHVGKPHNLDNLCYLAQEIDVCYWEHKEEVQCTNKSSGTSNFPAHKPGSSAPNSSKGKPTTSSNTSSSSGNANSSLSKKPKSSNGGNKLSNATSSNPNLTGKLGKDSKLTLEERKQHLDNKLCMFCGDDGYFSNNCPKKANKGAVRLHLGFHP
ncbi:hypothetical protein ID866_9875 [Astraeus odoratus]|nr:hypothetical protein ID866_9875 [Astraeus odoratus]